MGRARIRTQVAREFFVAGAVRCASWCRSGKAADQGNCRCRPAVEPAVVDPAGPYQCPPWRVRRPVPSRDGRPPTSVLAALHSGPHGQRAMPERHLSEPYLAARLAARGLYARQARNTALAAFASDKPTPGLGIPSREVGGVRSCGEQKAIGALGQDLLSSSPSLTWVRKTISLPGRSGASRTSRTLNP
jgi:hypothetical protein